MDAKLVGRPREISLVARNDELDEVALELGACVLEQDTAVDHFGDDALEASLQRVVFLGHCSSCDRQLAAAPAAFEREGDETPV